MSSHKVEEELAVVVQNVGDGVGNEGQQSFLEIFKELTKFSVPYLSSAIVDVARTFIINAYLAKLGSDENAAGAEISTIQMVTVSMLCCSYATGIDVGATYKAAPPERLAGETDEQFNARHQAQITKSLSEIMNAAAVASVGISIPLVALCLLARPFLNGLNQDADLVELAGRYYDAYAWGVPGFVGVSFLRQYVLGRKTYEDASVVLGSMAINTAVAGIMGYVLTFGIGGWEGMGIEGLGYANACAFWVSFAALAAYIARSDRYNPGLKLAINKAWEQLEPRIHDIAVVGGAITVRAFSEFLSLFVLTIMASSFGDDALEADQVAIQYLLLMIIPSFGLTQATSIMSAGAFAHNDNQGVLDVTVAGLSLSTIINTMLCTVMYSAPKPLISLFLNVEENHGVYVTAKNLLFINAATQLTDGPRNVLSGVLNTGKDQMNPLIAGVGMNVVLALVLGYVLAFQADTKTEGLFLGRLIMTTLSTIFLGSVFVGRVGTEEIAGMTARAREWFSMWNPVSQCMRSTDLEAALLTDEERRQVL